MSTPQVEAFLEMMAVERDASPHTLSAYGRDLDDAESSLVGAGGLMAALPQLKPGSPACQGGACPRPRPRENGRLCGNSTGSYSPRAGGRTIRRDGSRLPDRGAPCPARCRSKRSAVC